MKIKDGYMTRPMGENHIVVAIDDIEDEFDGLITLNNSGLFIWEKLQNDITYDDLLQSIVDHYDAPKDIIKTDLDKFLSNAEKANLLIK